MKLNENKRREEDGQKGLKAIVNPPKTERDTIDLDNSGAWMKAKLRLGHAIVQTGTRWERGPTP